MNLKYQLSDDVPTKENILYGFQQVIFIVVSAVVMPVVVGYALGLPQAEVAYTLQRTFFLCGVVTMLQMKWGHLYPIIDGPAGLWSGLFIAMIATLPSIDKTTAVLRTDLEAGMIIAGAIVIIFAVFGLINKIAQLFTPLINGVLMFIMSLQISSSIVKGMTGVSTDHPQIYGKSVLIFGFTAIVILLINNYAKGFIQSIATFIGVICGWIMAALLGEADTGNLLGNGIFSVPKIFAWGRPTFDFGITITCIIGAFVLISTVLASISGMADAVNDIPEPSKIRNSITIHGIATVLTGLFSTIAFMPYVSSTGIVQMTGVAARKPLYLASVCMIIMGTLCPVGAFFACIPGAVGNAALVMVFAMILGSALKEFRKVNFTNRESFIVGVSILIGTGIMFLPSSSFDGLPQVARCLFSNGLIDGMILAFLLEHVILRKRKNDNTKTC